MVDPISELTIDQRVRIIEEEEPLKYIGKLAKVKRIETLKNNERICLLQVDGSVELVSLPEQYLRPIVTMPSSLLANDLFLPWDTDDPNIRFQQYCQDRQIAGQVLESLMYYERILIPTVDFAIIVPLVHWLGVGLLKELLASDALSFVRYTGTLGYSGNGVGLFLFEIRPGEKKPDTWWVRASRCTPREAIVLQLQNRLQGLKEREIDLLATLVELCTSDTRLPEFSKKVEHETYNDILGNQDLRTRFAIRNDNLKSLSGIKPDQVRVFTRLSKPAVAGDEIDITLRLAMLNLEAYLAEEAGARDMVTDKSFNSLLEAKVQRYTSGRIARESFSRLITMEEIPDLVTSIADGQLDLARVWQFRNTSNASQFRQWFDKAGPADPNRLMQEYVKMLRDGGLWGSGRAKLIRFITLQLIGAALSLNSGIGSIIASTGLGAVDSFLLDRIRLGYNPRYFIDELRHQFFSN